MTAQKTSIPPQLLEHLLDAEKLKNCFECGICTASCPMNELVPNHYNPRILLEKIYQTPEKALRDPALWLCAWCYRCYKRCPQKVKLPEVLLAVRKIAKEQSKLDGFNRAAEIINKEIPFPASFGLVCLHPERVGLDNATESFSARSMSSRRRKTKTSLSANVAATKVAVVGAGPAGLTAAYELANKGYMVTVFEAASQPGGMLKQCIPEFRLPKKVLDAEIEHIKDLGVQIKTNVTIGKDLQLAELRQQGFKAIFVSIGAHRTRKLGVEGESLNSIFDALDFLQQTNNNENRVNVGERVAVVGGGNVAIDSARTALRLGAKEATILYRRSRDEMPANPYEIREAEDEGVKMQFLAAPKRFIGQNGHVNGVECFKMALGEPDQSGRRAPQPIEGSEFTVPVDTVILAIGEAPDTSFLPKEIEMGEGNTIAVEPFAAETSQHGIFAGGDCVTGPATLIEAVLAGKRAADCIDQYLKKEEATGPEEILEGGRTRA